MVVLDAQAVSSWATACVDSLERLRGEIDGINVYPVADADTGSNLLYTLTGARDALASEALETLGAGSAIAVLARGAVRAARGNSGVIISQLLRGLAGPVGDASEIDGRQLAAALRLADQAATDAVAHPVSGTMLSVLHAAATAGAHGCADSVADVARKAADAASEALRATTGQLPALAVAGVVDAGGRGLVAVLDALVAVLTGKQPDQQEPPHPQPPPAVAQPMPRAWEVMYLLTGAEPAQLPQLRARLAELGDSVTVAADGAGAHAVHVHCADIGAAIEAGLLIGKPQAVRVEPLLTPPAEEGPSARNRGAVVALVHGTELAELIQQEGVRALAVPSGTQPSTEQLLGLITETASGHVTVLAGTAGLTETAEALAEHPMVGDREVVTVPCASPVQVLSAIAVHDAARRAGDNVVAMAEAAAATRRGEVRVASGDALTWVGRAHAGDVVGLVDDEVVLIGPAASTDVRTVAMDVLARMLTVGGELVTVLTGASAPEGIGAELDALLRAAHPEVESAWYAGGQEDAVLLMGVE